MLQVRSHKADTRGGTTPSYWLCTRKQIRSLKKKGQTVFKLGLVWPARQIKFASDKGNQITTRKVEEEFPLFKQSGDWMLQFDLAYNEDGQRKNGPFPAHIATTGKRPDGQEENLTE